MKPRKHKKLSTFYEDEDGDGDGAVGGRGGRDSAGGASQRAAKAAKRESFERGKAPARDPVELVDDEDEDAPDENDVNAVTMTQQYQSQLDSYDTQAVVQKLSLEEKDKLVAEVMRTMLFMQHRDGAPVQRQKLSELVTRLSPQLKRANVASYVIAQAQLKFAQIFGYEMKELERAQAKRSGAGRGAVVASEPTKEYVLKSMLPARLRREWVDQPEELAERGFCVTVCALVSIAGGKIEEDALWKHLRALGVHPEDEAHPKLGNARAALARLQKRRYLIRERLGRDEERGEEKYALALAERALDELGQEGVDAFVQEVMRGENEDDQGEEDQGGTTNNGEGRE